MKKQIFISIALGLTFLACSNKNSKSDNKSNESRNLTPMSVSDTSGNVSSDSTATNGSIIPIAKMQNPRAAHTATLLKNGTVLLCGGFTGRNSLSSAEIYNPTSKSFTQIKNLTTPRSEHSATLLPNGKVLIAGGYNGSYLSSTEIYDSELKTFSKGPNMNSARSGHTATLLNNGKILFAGGVGTGWTFLSSAEIYDIQTNKFTPINSMVVARESHTATLLNNGNVLITGGHRDRRENIKIYSSCEIYDSKSNQFSATGSMTIPRQKHDAVVLTNGKVLINGGSDQRDSRGIYSSAEMYDPNTSKFSTISDMNYLRYKHKGTSILLTDNNVLIAGGSHMAEIYNSKSGKFTPLQNSMKTSRLFSCATLLGNGEVLITGGYDDEIKTSEGAWLFVK